MCCVLYRKVKPLKNKPPPGNRAGSKQQSTAIAKMAVDVTFGFFALPFLYPQCNELFLFEDFMVQQQQCIEYKKTT